MLKVRHHQASSYGVIRLVADRALQLINIIIRKGHERIRPFTGYYLAALRDCTMDRRESGRKMVRRRYFRACSLALNVSEGDLLNVVM
jgi:hypothetical protein